jgi:hypothetical protein
MMPEPPESEADEASLAGTALAPPAGVTGWRVLYGERDNAPVFKASCNVKGFLSRAHFRR